MIQKRKSCLKVEEQQRAKRAVLLLCRHRHYSGVGIDIDYIVDELSSLDKSALSYVHRK